MLLLSRDDYCRLTGIDLEMLKSLQRRDQVPTVPGPGAQGNYTPLASVLMEIANEFADGQGINRTRAALLASHGFCIYSRWKEVAETSEALFSGQDVSAELFLAVAEDGRERSAFCGTIAQISRKFPSPVRLALANVSRAAAVVRMRAARDNIDLGDFWVTK